MKIICSATATTTANGTMQLVATTQRDRDVALAKSICACGHKRILHFSGNAFARDWRGATGPCQHLSRRKRCACASFVPAPPLTPQEQEP
jgi:hypothetical protein